MSYQLSFRRMTILALSLTFFLFGCSKNEGSSRDTGNERNRAFEGNLEEKYGAIFSKKNESFFEPCDFENRSHILEIAKELERRRPELVALAKKAKETKDNATQRAEYNLNGFVFIENTFPVVTQTNEWSAATLSWKNIWDEYLKMKDQPVNLSWLWLDRVARGLAPDEESRLVALDHQGISRDSEIVMRETLLKMEACIAEASCVYPSFSESQVEWIKKGSLYEFYLNCMQNANKTSEEKRACLTKLEKWTRPDLSRFEFRINPEIQPTKSGITVPLRMNIFGNEASQFISLMKKYWDQYGFSISIENSSIEGRGFLIDVDQNIGDRAFVSYKEKRMQLRNFGSVQTAAHELGHVLGFRDVYFTTFDRTKCEWQDEYNPSDLMSDSTRGKIQPYHWDQLKSVYKIQ